MGDRYFPLITLSTESPRMLAEMERNVQHSRPAAPALSTLLNTLFVFDCILSKLKTLDVLKEEEERSRRAVGSLLLQIQMFIRSAKHRYKVSWTGERGGHVASSEVSCPSD